MTFFRATLPLALLSMLAIAETPAAPERWFQVEVMIFENPEIEVDNAETWPSFPEFNHPESYIRLKGITEILTSNSDTQEISADESNTPDNVIEVETEELNNGLEAFVALSEFERQLNEQHKKLDSSRGFRVLFHEAWNQPVPGRDQVIPIRIDAGERFGRQSELQGYLNLYVERYLHLSTDLQLIKYEKSTDPFSVIGEFSSATNNSQSLDDLGGFNLLNADSLTNTSITRKSDQFYISVRSAQLKESRRMRSKEIHYLDNPLFGMLVLITPIDVQ